MRVDRLAVGCAAGALLVVLAAAEGLSSPSGRSASLPGAPLPTPTPTQPPTQLTPVAGGGAPDLPGWVAPALVALVAALVVAGLALMAAHLWQRRRSRPEALDPLDDAAGAAAGGVVDAPVVRRGIARSLEALEDPRDLDDAVVRAWLGLEETAQDAGVAREPSETPTEFTTRLLRRVPADREAVDVLRTLYSRARFGARSPAGPGAAAKSSTAQDDDAVERARAALRALARSWDAS